MFTCLLLRWVDERIRIDRSKSKQQAQQGWRRLCLSLPAVVGQILLRLRPAAAAGEYWCYIGSDQSTAENLA